MPQIMPVFTPIPPELWEDPAKWGATREALDEVKFCNDCSGPNQGAMLSDWQYDLYAQGLQAIRNFHEGKKVEKNASETATAEEIKKRYDLMVNTTGEFSVISDLVTMIQGWQSDLVFEKSEDALKWLALQIVGESKEDAERARIILGLIGLYLFEQRIAAVTKEGTHTQFFVFNPEEEQGAYKKSEDGWSEESPVSFGRYLTKAVRILQWGRCIERNLRRTFTTRTEEE